MREARVGARLVGGGGARIIKFYGGGGSFSMSAIFILYVRVIFSVCGFFLLRMVRYAWSGGGGGGEFCGCPSPLTIHSCGKPFLSHIVEIIRGVARIWEGGGPRIFFFRFGNLHVAKPYALLGGFGGMPQRKLF